MHTGVADMIDLAFLGTFGWLRCCQTGLTRPSPRHGQPIETWLIAARVSVLPWRAKWGARAQSRVVTAVSVGRDA